MVAAVAIPSLAAGASASNSKSFEDSRAENLLAPDIVRTAVSNTDASDLRFAITLSNRPVFSRDMLVLIFVDTKSGGDPQSAGADWVIQIESGLPLLFGWDGKDFTRSLADGGLGYRYPTTGPIVELSALALGSPTQLRFSVLVGSGATRNAAGETVYSGFKADAAPNDPTQMYSYNVVAKTRLAAGPPLMSPAKPKAGGSLAVVVEVAANDLGPLDEGKVRCTAKLAGAPVPVRVAKLGNGVATCGFKLPAGKRGKLTGTIAVTDRGLTATRSFSATVG